MKSTLYIPIEIKVREFPAKVLLALVAAKCGFRVYLGSKRAVDHLVYNKKVKAGIYLYKGGRSLVDLRRIKEKVDCFVLLDEEMGPAVRNLEQAYKGRIYANTEPMIDKVFLISEEHRLALSKVRPGLRGKAMVTGWPRVDLWRPMFKSQYNINANKIKNTHGDFLLFSSDFGMISEAVISVEAERMKSVGYSKDDIDYRIEAMTDMYHEFIDFVELVKTIDRDPLFPPVVIRPHPSEDIRVWKAKLSGLEKVRIIYEGEVSPWLYASKGLLHRGCTTAVQAYMAGVPSIYVLGKHSRPVTDTLPYGVSLPARDYIELRNLSSAAFGGHQLDKVTIDISKKIYMEDKLASELIVEELAALSVTQESQYLTSQGLRLRRHLRGHMSEAYTSYMRVTAKMKGVGVNEKMKGGVHRNETFRLARSLMPNEEFIITEPDFNLIEIYSE